MFFLTTPNFWSNYSNSSFACTQKGDNECHLVTEISQIFSNLSNLYFYRYRNLCDL